MKDVRIAPSLLSADFAHLARAISAVEEVGVDILHVDVMDGHFVPNLTFGPLIVKAIRDLAVSELDVHLMISKPDLYLERFIEAGSTYVTFHVEAVDEARALVERAKSLGARAGVAINPETSLEAARPAFEVSDLIVMMTVHPGFGGQGFIREVVPKIRELWSLRETESYGFKIEVDGGVSIATAPIAAWAGSDILVAGAAIYKSGDPQAAVKAIAEAAQEGASKRSDPHAFPLAPA
jgi:ribulose-phosphate 3-epimerase